jgi:hypothetical protein
MNWTFAQWMIPWLAGYVTCILIAGMLWLLLKR